MKPEKKAVQLSEDGKLVLNLLKEKSPMELNALKDQTIKGLTKNKLAKVEKTEEGLFVKLV